MRKMIIVAIALGTLATSGSAYAYKPGYPEHCHMVKSCHKNTDFPCANNSEPTLPICKKQVCTMVKECN
jgi:hypothetical protein